MPNLVQDGVEKELMPSWCSRHVFTLVTVTLLTLYKLAGSAVRFATGSVLVSRVHGLEKSVNFARVANLCCEARRHHEGFDIG